MEIIKNPTAYSNFLSNIRSSKDELLLKKEKELLRMVSETLSIVHGGQYNKNKLSA